MKVPNRRVRRVSQDLFSDEKEQRYDCAGYQPISSRGDIAPRSTTDDLDGNKDGKRTLIRDR